MWDHSLFDATLEAEPHVLINIEAQLGGDRHDAWDPRARSPASWRATETGCLLTQVRGSQGAGGVSRRNRAV